MKKFNKKFVYGTGSATLIAGVCIVILLLNLIAGLLSDKFGLKLDATETGLSFSSEFNEYIKSVDKEIDVYYMCNPNEMIRISGKNDITETTGQVDNSNYRIRIKYMFENKENHSIISAIKPILTVEINTLNKNIVKTNTKVMIAETN